MHAIQARNCSQPPAQKGQSRTETNILGKSECKDIYSQSIQLPWPGSRGMILKLEYFPRVLMAVSLNIRSSFPSLPFIGDSTFLWTSLKGVHYLSLSGPYGGSTLYKLKENFLAPCLCSLHKFEAFSLKSRSSHKIFIIANHRESLHPVISHSCHIVPYCMLNRSQIWYFDRRLIMICQ